MRAAGSPRRPAPAHYPGLGPEAVGSPRGIRATRGAAGNIGTAVIEELRGRRG